MSSTYGALSKMLSAANDICLFKVQIEWLVATAYSNTPLTGRIKQQPAYLCIIKHNLRLENIKRIFQVIFQQVQKDSHQALIHVELMCSFAYTHMHMYTFKSD